MLLSNAESRGLQPTPLRLGLGGFIHQNPSAVVLNTILFP